MSSAKEIRAAATQQAEALGINPTVAIGIIEELSQYGTVVRGGRVGVFGAPQDMLGPGEDVPRDWQSQLDLGLRTFATLKETAGVDDILALVSYIGGRDAPMRAMRALERGARYTGEAFDAAEMKAALSLMTETPEPPGVGVPALPVVAADPAPARSADRQVKQRLESAFEEDPEVADVPAHLTKLIEAITDE